MNAKSPKSKAGFWRSLDLDGDSRSRRHLGFAVNPAAWLGHCHATLNTARPHACHKRCAAAQKVSILSKCPPLEKRLNRYSQEMALQVSQVAACNRLHEVEERLARWLLMSQDRVGVSTFPLTQQFIAHMLGTRRASVTVAAGILQRAGLITYQRGQVKIESRTKLESAACECYRQLNQQIRSWHENSR